jgi:UTP--glucose-1-phosphate uridylyltransferase
MVDLEAIELKPIALRSRVHDALELLARVGKQVGGSSLPDPRSAAILHVFGHPADRTSGTEKMGERVPVGFRWDEIDRALKSQSDLELRIDREWTEQRAGDLAERRLSTASNRLSVDPEPAGRADVDAMAALPAAEQRELAALGKRLLAEGKVAAAVLNGGMATRFGGAVKGVVPAVGGRSFLELKLRQSVQAGAVPLLAMNSFATHVATQELLAKLHSPPLREAGSERAKRSGSPLGWSAGHVRCFLQSVALRLDPSGAPFCDASGAFSFYAPGHGEFCAALQRSGELARLERDGVELLVLSNVDNLGADVDPRILVYHRSRGRPITCEVARTVPGDKGGSPARVNGRLQIVEGFRFPVHFDFERLVYLSTNTFVFSTEVLRSQAPLRWYYVEKQVDGRPAVQIESVVNELTQKFPTNFLEVPRSGAEGRFFPVKTPDDLEAIRADAELVQRFSS